MNAPVILDRPPACWRAAVALIVSFSLTKRVGAGSGTGGCATRAEASGQPRHRAVPGFLDSYRRRRQHHRVSPARPNSVRVSRPPFSRSPPKSWMLPLAP